ncbi:MAG: thioredoxin family protein [Candidatus Nanoarchaeia archaeon]
MKQQTVLEIDLENYNEFLQKELAILHFFSDWQINSLMAIPIIESLAEEFEQVGFGKVNIEEYEELAERYEINKPVILIFKQGKPIERIYNCDCEDILREKISCLI